jgi:hypothetical protein
MNDLAVVVYKAPFMLMALCYLGGMAVLVALVFWLGRLALGYGNTLSLRETIALWLIRVLAALAIVSLGRMIWLGPENKLTLLPEAATLLLLAALFLITQKQKGFIGLAVEISKCFVVVFSAIVGWAVSALVTILLFQIFSIFHAPPWMAMFTAGILWNVLAGGLYMHAYRKNRTGKLKFYQILWPVLLAYALVMIPGSLESTANSPKVREIMQASPRMQRA